jgi:D-glycero-D-manno-heptose 1,7-bisphosphate phosphatase
MNAIFLDRDGVVNRKAPEGKYVTRVTGFEVLPGALEAIAALSRNGYEVFVVTNQRGLALGQVSRSDLREIHARMLDRVRQAGGKIRQIYVCPHDTIDRCACRKPQPGLLLQAQREHGIDLRASWMIGDTASDIVAGSRAGCRTAFIGAPHLQVAADLRASSLREVVGHLLRQL